MISQSLHYYTINYDKRTDGTKTKITDKIIQETLATLLVSHKCQEMKCYVETTVHFSSHDSLELWVERIKQYFGHYIVFVLEEIKLDEKRNPMNKVHYNPHNLLNYKTTLENNYDTLISNLQKSNSDEWSKSLGGFLTIDV